LDGNKLLQHLCLRRNTRGARGPFRRTPQSRIPQILPFANKVVFTAVGFTGPNAATIEALSLPTGKRPVMACGDTYGRYRPNRYLTRVNHGTLFAMPFNINRMEQRGAAVPVLQGVSYSSTFGFAQWDFSTRGALVYRKNLGGESLSIGQNSFRGIEPSLSTPGEYLWLRLSPDGKKLALSVTEGGTASVWITKGGRRADRDLTGADMSYKSRSATGLACIIALGVGSMTTSAQVTVDLENRYSNVGVIMVWRVDDAGKPVELRGFASGTLIRDRVMVTAGHFTAPATSLGSLPPSIRIFASFSPTDAKDPKTWIPVVAQATHPSMPHCPPPPQCDPTDDVLVAPLEPGIADVGLIFLAHAPPGIKPAHLAVPGTLDRSEGAQTTIAGYGTTTPRRNAPPGTPIWDGKRRIRTSAVRRVIDETWALWSIPSYVCSGDSGGGIFLNLSARAANAEVLAASVSDGGRDCRRHNNNNRLDTRSTQTWINDTVRQHPYSGSSLDISARSTIDQCRDQFEDRSVGTKNMNMAVRALVLAFGLLISDVCAETELHFRFTRLLYASRT
jgi:hypothetical protein